MKTILISFYVVVALIVFGCSKGNDKSNPITSLDNPAVTSSAPINIVGKDLILKGSSGGKVAEAYSFTASNTCAVYEPLSSYTVIGTPSYIYTKNSTYSASFTLTYSDKYYSNTSNYVNYNNTISVSLSFTSSSAGTYTGTSRYVGSGRLSGSVYTPSNQWSIGGAFTLN